MWLKRPELARAVYSRRFDQGKRKGAFHILFHVEKCNRSCDRRTDQRSQERVFQPHGRYELYESESRHLGRNHHDHQDERINIFLQPEIICVDGIRCHRGKIYAQYGAAACDDQTVQHPPHNGESPVKQIVPVVKGMRAWQKRKARLQFAV